MYIRLKNGTIYNLASPKISSWEYVNEERAKTEYNEPHAFYYIYYYDPELGAYHETDDKGGNSADSFYESEILITSNVIDSLADEYVVEYIYSWTPNPRNYKKVWNPKDSTFEDIFMNKKKHPNKYNVYASIWVGATLKPIAKLNDEGEFELL